MKRLTLLMTGLLIISIFVASSVCASTSRSDSRYMAIRVFVARYLTRLVDQFNFYVELPIDDAGNGDILGGDADDYANGRDGEEPEADDKRSGRLNAGPAVIGPGEYKPIYRFYYSH